MTGRVCSVLFLIRLACAGGCMPVTGDRILGRDLALAEPALAGLPATFVVGFAPVPGERRTLATAELSRIARSNGIHAGELPEVCFELPLRRLESAAVAAAMLRGLPAGVQLEIVELGKVDVPPGDVEFPVAGLEPADTAGSRMWRGWVRYANTRKQPVWARVKVQEEYVAVVAVKDIAAGAVLDTEGLRIEKRTGPLSREQVVRRIEDVRGQVLKRQVKAGAAIPVSLLTLPLAVKRGETVRVEVASGWARLHFEAVAESDAREGDLIALRNPVSGKTFRAKVGANGRVRVVIGGSVL